MEELYSQLWSFSQDHFAIMGLFWIHINVKIICPSSVKNMDILILSFNCSVMFNSSWPHGLQQARFLSFIISRSLLKLMSIELMTPSNQLILCVPFSLCPQSFPASGSFPMLGIKWPKFWNFNFSISPSKEYSGLTSFKTDWFVLTVQGSLKSLLHYTVWKHQFFSILYGPTLISVHATEKTIVWLDGPLSAKWCLCFLIHCLGFHSFSFKEEMSFNLMAAVTILNDFGVQKNKVSHCFHCFPHLFAMKWWDPMTWY